MIRRPPRSTRTDTLFPYTTLFRSARVGETVGRSTTHRLDGVRVAWKHPDWLADLASDLDHATRVAMRLRPDRSEEHTSELQSLMRISYAVFCLKKKNTKHSNKHTHTQHTTTPLKTHTNNTST